MKFRNSNLPLPILFLLLAIVQLGVAERISISGVKPSLIAGIVFAVAINGGDWKGLVFGATGGFIEDCLSGGIPGLFTSAYALAGFLTGRAGRRLLNIESANLTGIFLFSMVSGVYISIVLETFKPGTSIVEMILRAAVPQAAYNAVAGAALLFLLNYRLPKRRSFLPGAARKFRFGER